MCQVSRVALGQLIRLQSASISAPKTARSVSKTEETVKPDNLVWVMCSAREGVITVKTDNQPGAGFQGDQVHE